MAERPLIAVVDDEASVRLALTRVLQACSFEVTSFASGQEFLDSLSGRPPDCVVLDFQMPGLTGGDVQRQLALARIRLPIIVVTAHDQPLVRERCLAEGAVAYLYKPLRRDNLLATINTALGR